MSGFDVHPILVHFPIALLSLYAILEIARFKILTRQQFYFYLKATLAIVGSLFTIPTGIAGKLAKDQHHLISSIVETHEKFAIASAAIFLFIGFLYFLAWIKPQVTSKNLIITFAFFAEEFIFKYNIIIPLALIGLFLITITGALGGIIVFGPSIDPLSQFLFSTFFR